MEIKGVFTNESLVETVQRDAYGATVFTNG